MGLFTEAHHLLVVPERRRHALRIAHARRLHHQDVKAQLRVVLRVQHARQLPHLLQQVLPPAAADTAVAKLDELLVLAHQPAVFDHLVVEVDLTDVVDDHRHAQSLSVPQDVRQERRLA